MPFTGGPPTQPIREALGDVRGLLRVVDSLTDDFKRLDRDTWATMTHNALVLIRGRVQDIEGLLMSAQGRIGT